MKLFPVQRIIIPVFTFLILFLFISITSTSKAQSIWGIQIKSQTGNTVVIGISPGASGNQAIHIYDATTNALVHDSGGLTGNTYTWTAGGDGSFYAQLSTSTGSGGGISNKAKFSVVTNVPGTTECGSFETCTDDAPTADGFGASTFITDLVTKFLPIAITLGGFLSVIIVVISGLQFISSNGNPEGAAAARGRLIFALVGFVLLTLAFAITKVIDTLFLGGSGIF